MLLHIQSHHVVANESYTHFAVGMDWSAWRCRIMEGYGHDDI